MWMNPVVEMVSFCWGNHTFQLSIIQFEFTSFPLFLIRLLHIFKFAFYVLIN